MISVSRYDQQRVCARFTDYREEMTIKKAGMWKFNEQEKAYILPRPRLVDLVAISESDGRQIEYPQDIYDIEKQAKINFESTVAWLRLIRSTGVEAADIDYFSEGRYKGSQTPRVHQLVAFQYHMMLDCSANLSEMGAGKTLPAIMAADERINRGEVFACLIVGPKNVLWNWEREIQQAAPHRKVVTLSGSRDTRFQQLDRIADFYLLNYEGLRVMGEELKDRFQMVILDEAHKIKDPSAVQTKIIRKYLRFVPYKIIMTGTPIGNILLDLHQPFTWLDQNMFEPSFYQFRERHFYQMGWKWFPHATTQPMMQEAIFTRSVRYMKKECLDLPEKQYITRYTYLAEKQKAVYDSVMKQFITEFGEGKIRASNVLSQIMKFSQITSGFVKDIHGKDLEFPENAKMKLLIDVLDEVGEKKVVIWARFVHDIKAIAEQLGSRALKFFGESHESPGEIVDLFNLSPVSKVQYLVANPAVGGVGLNLTAADTFIYYSNDYSFIKRSQSEDRGHRIGAEKHEKITIIDLVVKNTIDPVVVAAQRHKKELSAVVIDAFKAGIIQSFDIDIDSDKMTALSAIFEKMGGTVEIKEPECAVCHSKNVMPVADQPGILNCNDCKTVGAY